MRKVHRQACALFSSASLFVLASTNTVAQVYVNGQLYQGAALNQLTQQYGAPIPPGNYWLLDNGNWGYMGDPNVKGNFYSDNKAQPSQRKSFWEDEVADQLMQMQR